MFFCLPVFFLITLSPSGMAQDYSVNSTADRVDNSPGDGNCDTGERINGTAECTLRAATQEAAALLSSAHVINIPAGTYLLSLTPQCSYYVNGNPNIYSASTVSLCLRGQITLKGAGAETTVLDAQNLGRVLYVSAEANATVDGLTVQHGVLNGGSYDGGGGGLVNQGTVTITNSVFTQNNVDNHAGGPGAYNYRGTMTVSNSTFIANGTIGAGGGIASAYGLLYIDKTLFTDNTASDGGGGVFAYLTQGSLSNSTIVHNNGSFGGGVWVEGGSASEARPYSITNTTIAYNHADRGAGGVFLHAGTSITLRNITIAYNSSENNQGGITANTDNNVQQYLYNSIVAGNTSTGSGVKDVDCLGYFISNGHNLIGTLDNQDLCKINGSTGDLINVDARLGDLADNGGGLQTVGLTSSSPAIDAGSPLTPGTDPTACPATDERGTTRPQGAACDIGAFERSKDFALSSVLPKRAASAGTVLLTVSGNGISAGAVLKLSRSGQNDITASDVTVDGGGSSASTFLDLTGAQQGTWDVSIVNANGSSATLPQALTVDQPEIPKPWAILTGPKQVRPNIATTYIVTYGNSGNTEALAVPLQISVPANFDISVPQIATPPQQSGQVTVDWSKSGYDAHVNQPGALRTLMFLLPSVPPGGRYFFGFRLTPRNVEEGDRFYLNAEVGDPYYVDQSINPSILSQIVSGAQTYAQTLGGTVSNNVLGVMQTYAANQLNLEIQNARSALAGSLSGSPLVYALPQNTQDIAEYGLSLSGSYSLASAQAPLTLRSALVPGLAVSSRAGNPYYTTTPRCSGTVLTPGSSCTDPYGPVATPKDPLLCALLGAASISTSAGECSPPPRRGCPYDPNCSGPSPSTSVDPNGKYGQFGLGDQGYLASGNPMQYLITFENQPTATAPAATVSVTDQLDTSGFDLSSFSFGPIGFGDYKLTPAPGQTSFTGELDLRPSQNVVVKVDASLNTSSGQLKWVFTSLDPDTGMPISSATEGFLPPNTAPPNGDGYVSYSLFPASPTDGKKICNQASIVFDTNEAIETDNWCNSYDDSPPSSSVESLPAIATSTTFNVSWNGQDSGSGVGSYTIFVSDNGGPFAPWQTNVSDNSASYTGQEGHTYAFYSLATDRLGHTEASKSVAEVSITVNSVNAPTATTTILTGPTSLSVGATATLSINVSSSAGTPTGRVTVSNGDTTLGTATLDSSGNATLTTAVLSAGNYSLTATYAGNGSFSASTSAVLALTVMPPADFTVAVSSPTLSVTSGESATTAITFTPANGFSSPIIFTCSNLPQYAGCSFSPSTITPSGATANVNVTLTTLQAKTAATRAAAMLGLSAFTLLLWSRRKRMAPGPWALTVFVLLLGVAGAVLTGCGDSHKTTTPPSNNALVTPAGTYSITVTATGGGVSHSTMVSLQVK